MQRVGLIGAGSIGKALIQAFKGDRIRGHRLCAVLVRPGQRRDLSIDLPEALVTDDVDAFHNAPLDVVIEAAGHEAAKTQGLAALAAGRDLYLMSVGVLADGAIRSAFIAMAERHGGRTIIPSGGLAGFDGLRAMTHLGLFQVTYTSTKPPLAWVDTPGEAVIQATGGEVTAVIVFEGNAEQAALRFPKNANLAAAVAIAGVGFERTQIRLVSDPKAKENIGTISARTAEGLMELTMSGSAFGSNPKSSQITTASILAALHNNIGVLSFR